MGDDRLKACALRVIAASSVKPGQSWLHVETQGLYKVTAVGIDEEAVSPVVVYVGQDGVTWVRPLSAFLGKSRSGKPRFELVMGRRVEEFD